MKLSELVSDSEAYNIADLKLFTDDLDDPIHAIMKDTAYNFGFEAISICGEDKAKFLGNNANYNLADNSLTLPTEVVFTGNDSLFPIPQTYGHGILTGEKLSNENSADKSYVLKWLFS